MLAMARKAAEVLQVGQARSISWRIGKKEHRQSHLQVSQPHEQRCKTQGLCCAGAQSWLESGRGMSTLELLGECFCTA